MMEDICQNLQKGALFDMRKSTDLREEVLIDSQTTHDVWCNTKYVSKIRKKVKRVE